MVVLKEKRFTLRPYREGDELQLRQAINDPRVVRQIVNVPNPYSMRDARSWVQRNLCSERSRKPDMINWAIVVDGKIVGGLGLHRIESPRAEIGYWLAPAYWGRGIMTAAVRLVVRFGFEKRKLRRIYALVFPVNKASQRVLEKNGFRLEGRLRKNVLKDKKPRDDLLYAKIR